MRGRREIILERSHGLLVVTLLGEKRTSTLGVSAKASRFSHDNETVLDYQMLI